MINMKDIGIESMNSRDKVEFMQFIYGIYVGSCPQINVLRQSSCYHLLGSSTHNLLQTSVHNILLLGTLQQQTSIELLQRNIHCLLNNCNQVVLSLLLPFPLHTSRPHVVQIFQPLKVTDSHTTSITQDIRKEVNTSFDEDFFSFESSRPISSLNNKFRLEFVSIIDIDCLLKCSRNKEITLLIDG